MLPFKANPGHYAGFDSYDGPSDFQNTQILSHVQPYHCIDTDHYNHVQFGQSSFSPYLPFIALPTYSQRFERHFANALQRSALHSQPLRRMFGAARRNMPPNAPRLVTGGERICSDDQGSTSTASCRESRPPSALAPVFIPRAAKTAKSSGSDSLRVSALVFYHSTASVTLPFSRRSHPTSALAPVFVPCSTAAEAAVQLQSYHDHTQSRSTAGPHRVPQAQTLYTNVFSLGREATVEDKVVKKQKAAPVRCLEDKPAEQGVSSPSRRSSSGSVGSWTDDEEFFPCVEKQVRLCKAEHCP